jgi:hypothetical protein
MEISLDAIKKVFHSLIETVGDGIKVTEKDRRQSLSRSQPRQIGVLI